MGGHDSHDDHSGHRDAVWHGLVTLGGIYLFFLVERIVGLYSERKRMQNERRLQVAFVYQLYSMLLVFVC